MITNENLRNIGGWKWTFDYSIRLAGIHVERVVWKNEKLESFELEISKLESFYLSSTRTFEGFQLLLFANYHFQLYVSRLARFYWKLESLFGKIEKLEKSKMTFESRKLETSDWSWRVVNIQIFCWFLLISQLRTLQQRIFPTTFLNYI